MTTTQSSRRAVFRCIAQTTYYEWPAYATTALYDRSSTGGLKEDAATVAGFWFDHDAHESTEEFVCYWPLAYATLDVHDRYTGQTRYGMEQLIQVFLLKELHRWTHETALISYLEQRPVLCRQLGFETIRTNRRSGGHGTVASRLISKRRLRNVLGRFSSKLRMLT